MPSTLPKPGAVVVIRRQRWRITDLSETGEVARIDALRLTEHQPAPVAFLLPFDHFDAGSRPRRPRRVRRQRWQAMCRGLCAYAEHVDLPLTMLTADVSVLSYQLEPLLAVRDGARRVLIADAVGLGKTVQAGLVIAELMRRGEAARVLIAAPGHLCPQWRDELRRRVRLDSRLADAATLASLAATLPRTASAWSLPGVWIGSVDFLKQPHVLAAMPLDPWDVVVIDEAHMVVGDSDRHVAAETLSVSARRLLLLTATPLSGLDDGRALIGLGALSRAEPLTVFRRTRADVGIVARRRVRRLRITPSAAERHMLDVVESFAAAADRAATASTSDATHLLLSVLRKRALSTAAALALSVDRRLAHLSGIVSVPADFLQPSFDFGDDDGAALRGTIGLAAEREQSWMRRLRAAATQAMQSSRKLSRLAALLARTTEPMILFTEFRDSLDAIAALLQRHGERPAIVHGGLSPADLQATLDTFRRGDSRVLLATDVASQGLNLHQRARWVIHIDVPWNPIRLEQRAGRVDRLGQTRDVHVTQLVLAHSLDIAFAARIDLRGRAAMQHATLSSDLRWHRHARAIAVVVERRRGWARFWRGPIAIGRPLTHHDAPHDIWSHDIDGHESAIRVGSRGTIGPVDTAVLARARRVVRLVVARARRAAEIERALFERMMRTGRATGDQQQLALPGAVTVADVRHAERARSERDRALQDVQRRIADMDRRISLARDTAPDITSRRELRKG